MHANYRKQSSCIHNVWVLTALWLSAAFSLARVVPLLSCGAQQPCGCPQHFPLQELSLR